MGGAVHLRPAAEIARGDVSALETVRSCMTSVVNGESGPERLNAFISFDYESAIARAERIDAEFRGGSVLPLAGVPVAVKDNICTLGLPTTCASRMLAQYRSPYEATVVRRLRAAGAIIAGKTNMDEFAMGSSTETSVFGPTRNPHDASRVPGGSSGGSAAAVAAGMVPVALGSDTGGSVRQPAAFCGVVGIRPTWGRVSRYGLVAFASSLDQIGTIGRSVEDAALVLDVISGADPLDATCAHRVAHDLHGAARDGVAGHRTVARVVGVPHEYFAEGIHPGVRRACERAIEMLRDAGCSIREVSLPHTRHAVAAYSVLASAEASTNLARFDGVHFGGRGGGAYEKARTAGFGREVKRRIMLGTFVLSAAHQEGDYAAAERVRSLIAADFRRAFEAGVDVIFTPTTPAPAFALGERANPYEMYSEDMFTAPASLARLPAVSIPIGTADALPVGGQVIAPHWCEDVMVATAARLEAAVKNMARGARR